MDTVMEKWIGTNCKWISMDLILNLQLNDFSPFHVSQHSQINCQNFN